MFDTMHGHSFDAYGTSLPNSTNLNGTITRVIDGDTVDISINEGITERIRLGLVDAPEYLQPGFFEAKNFVTQIIS